MSFERQVFINCPFDVEYQPLLKALVFTLIYFEFEPCLCKTVSSSNIRIKEIMKLIETCKYSVHDISRSEPNRSLPRFNMPYEMGIDIGCATFGNDLQRNKQCLILENTRNRYDRVLSDISGQDIKTHAGKPKKLMANIVEWFADNGAVPVNQIPGISALWSKYLDCKARIEITLLNNGFTSKEIRSLSISQFTAAVKSALDLS